MNAILMTLLRIVLIPVASVAFIALMFAPNKSSIENITADFIWWWWRQK